LLKKSTIACIFQAPAASKKCHYSSSFNTPAQKKLIDFMTSSAATRQMPLKEVKAQMSLQCSVRTIQKALAEEGYRHRIARKKP
jgi:hypothetical protein